MVEWLFVSVQGRNGVQGRGGGEEEEEDQAAVSMVTDHPPDSLSFVCGQPSATPPTLPPDPPPPSLPPPSLPPPPPTHQTNELDFNAFFNADSIPGLNVSTLLLLLLHLLLLLLLLLFSFSFICLSSSISSESS